MQIADRLLALSTAAPNGWLGVEDVRRAGLMPLDVYSRGQRLERVLEINPKAQKARLSNLDKKGRFKLNTQKDDVSWREIRLHSPEYRPQ